MKTRVIVDRLKNGGGLSGIFKPIKDVIKGVTGSKGGSSAPSAPDPIAINEASGGTEEVAEKDEEVVDTRKRKKKGARDLKIPTSGTGTTGTVGR